jgi:hypothetical protein
MAPHKLIFPFAIIRTREKREKRKNRTSLIKLGLSTEIWCGLIKILITPTTILETKKAPPKTLLRPTAPLPDLVKETIEAKTSGAPFPNERRVTPAMVGESFKILDKLSKEEQK